MKKQLKAIERAYRWRIRNPVMSRIRGIRYRSMPVAMITGTNGKTTTTRLLASILEQAGHTVGVATTDGVTIGGELIRSGDYAGEIGHRFIFPDKRVTAAALETARGGVLRQGFHVRPVTAAALLNVGNDHVGTEGIETVDDMARLKRRVIDAARHAVLNADDPRCLAIAGRYRPRRVTLFSLDPDHPALPAHIAAGGKAVVARDGWAQLLQKNPPPQRLVELALVPVTLGGRVSIYVSGSLAAAALGLALGASVDAVAKGLCAFRTGAASNPGRLTLVEGYPCTVVVDRALEARAFATVADIVRPMAGEGRRVAVVSGFGNRPDDHIRAFGRVVAERYDRAAIFEDAYVLRGRKRGEIAALIREGLVEGGMAEDAIATFDTLDAAVAAAARMTTPGGLLHIGSSWPDPEGLIAKAFGTNASKV